MTMRIFLCLLFLLTPFSKSFGGDEIEQRVKALEDFSKTQQKTIEEQQGVIDELKKSQRPDEGYGRQKTTASGARAGNLRLIDISMDALFAAGGSTEDDEELERLQGGGHDPRKRGFTVQNIELSLTGAIDPYLNGESHIIFFLDPLTGETELELEEVFLTTTSLSHGLQLEAGHFFTEFGRLNPRHPHPFRDDRHRISPLISWQPSEFSRLRFQYNFDRADHLPYKEAHSVWLVVGVMYGA